jgi:hypothetical protein
MNNLNFNFYGKKLSLSKDFISLIKSNGYNIINFLGQGSDNAAFEISNIKTKELKVLLIPINEYCNYFNQNLLIEYRKLQQNGVFNTDMMIKIYESINCSKVKITEDESFCKIGPSTVQIIEKIDKTLNEKIYEDMTFFEKITILIDISLWIMFVKDELAKKGYLYSDFSINNVGIIEDRLVLIDLISIIANKDIKPILLKFYNEKNIIENILDKDILFKDQTMEEYKIIIEFYNLIINAINRQKTTKRKELIVFEVKKILNYKYDKLTKMFFGPDFQTLHIPSESIIIKIDKIKCITILYNLFYKGTKFSTEYENFDKFPTKLFVYTDENGIIYLSPKQKF